MVSRWLMLSLFFIMSGYSTQTTQAQNPDSVWTSPYYAPYVLAGQMPLVVTFEHTGVRFYTLAFILAGRDCEATWNGAGLLKNIPSLPNEILKLRAKGGDVIVSLGGAAGDELALRCTDVESLTAQYQAVVDAYQLTHLDFDIEGDEIQDVASIQRRSQAIVVLQQRSLEAGRKLWVSLTLPVMPSGLTLEGLSVLQSAIDHDVVIDVVNLMTMDYGTEDSADGMGENAIRAANSVFEQLKVLYPQKEDADLWAMIGLTPMIGLNDVVPEVFTLADAEQVTAFAQTNGIRRLSMWAMSRDQSCVSDAEVVSIKCSGVKQEPFAFSSIFSHVADEH
jgi:hypothetical protein